MENDNNRHQEWADGRLGLLQAPLGWQPNTENAAQRFARLRKARNVQRRSLLAGGLTLAATGAVTLTSVPTARAFAGRCVDACVAQANTWMGSQPVTAGGLAPDAASLGLAALRGQVVLVNFWAPWCRPCVVEMPWFDEMQQAYGQSGFTVIGVSVEPGAKSKVKYRLIDDAEETLARAYQVEALPATFVIDRNGKVAFRHSGLVSKEVYEREVKSLLLQ